MLILWSYKHKLPLGIAALCVVSVFGLKDTGIFINAHVQKTYSGNEIEFSAGEKVNIVEKKGDDFVVQKGKAKVTIPQNKILLTEVDIPTYRVIKATPIYKDGKVIRNLFVGEYAVQVEDKGESITVKCNDGTVGDVARSSLDKIADTREHITPMEVKENAVAKSNAGSVKVKAGENVNVVNYSDGQFVIKANDGKRYTLNAKAFNLPTGQGDENAIQQDEKIIVRVAKEASSNEKYQLKATADSNSASGGIADRAVASAAKKLGSTYVWGATGDGGYDCSGLVYAVYKNELGINLPRTSSEMSEVGRQVSRSNLREGDLLFFNTAGNGVSHVGIYIGNGQFIHASSGQGKVITSSLSESYYSEHFVNATRVI